jgi:acyl-CoA synthetase (AMP-forming)/AMP-acid ligase II
MDIAVDLAEGTVALRDGANFRAFQVTATGAGGDDDIGDLLARYGAGRRCADPNHVWIAKAWLTAQAAAAPGGAPDGATPEEWAAGFDKMLGLAAKMGWLDDDATHIKAHTEWSVLTGGNLWELLLARAAATPDLEMLVDERGERVTYAEFVGRAEAVAAAILALGIGAGDVVSWILPSGIDAVVLSAALNRIDVVQNPIIPIYREREVAFCTQQTGARLLIVPGVWRGFDYGAMAERVAASHDSLQVLVAPRGALPMGDPATLPPVTPAPASDDDAPVRWYFYTSGTTSDPKGAQHTDRSLALVGLAMGERMDTRNRDRSGIAFPYTHIAGPTWMFNAAQYGTVLLLAESFDPKETPRYFAREGVTHAGSGTAFHLAYMDAQLQQPDAPLFPRLKNCPGGGAPKPPQIHADIMRVLGGRGVLAGWGLTEAPILTLASPKNADDKLATTEGFAMPGVELIAVKADGTLAAPGEEGELRAKAPQMMRGYLDASLDADAFDADGYFRTGDLGVIDADGFVVITGRLKDIIIRNGENISAKEVEDLLYTHPAVQDVAVVGLPDPRTGERACAVVAPKPGATFGFVEMQQFLRDAGMRMQAVPEQLELVDVIPRNPSGKIVKTELRDRYRGSQPAR